MKFSGKMCFKIILKVIKNQNFTNFTPSLEDIIFEKLHGGRGEIDPLPLSPLAVLGLRGKNELTIHQKNLQVLMTELYKIANGN